MTRPLNRLALISVAATALFAGVAQAEPVHFASMVHAGSTVTVSYEPQSTTKYKQTSMRTRDAQRCLWTTTAWVERRVTDASGMVIAAMTRKIAERTAGEGNETGYCNTVSPARTAAYSGDAARLKAFVVDAAGGDAGGLRDELASLGRTGSAS